MKKEYVEYLYQEKLKRKKEKEERINHLVSLSEGLIPEEKQPMLRLRIISDIDMSIKPVGYHVEKALMIIGYLNNEEITLEDVYSKFKEQTYPTVIDELKVAEVIRDFSSRGQEFFTIAYESLRPRLTQLRANAKLFMDEHPELFQDMLGATEELKPSGLAF